MSSEVLNNDEQAWLAEHGAIRIGYLNHDAGEKTEDGGLPDLGLDDEGLKAEGGDDEVCWLLEG